MEVLAGLVRYVPVGKERRRRWEGGDCDDDAGADADMK